MFSEHSKLTFALFFRHRTAWQLVGISTVTAGMFRLPKTEIAVLRLSHSYLEDVKYTFPETSVNSRQLYITSQKTVIIVATAVGPSDFSTILYVHYSEKHELFHEGDSVGEPIVGKHLLSHPVSEDDVQIYCGGISTFIGFSDVVSGYGVEIQIFTLKFRINDGTGKRLHHFSRFFLPAETMPRRKPTAAPTNSVPPEESNSNDCH
jgi:hypothetical protein